MKVVFLNVSEKFRDSKFWNKHPEENNILWKKTNLDPKHDGFGNDFPFMGIWGVHVGLKGRVIRNLNKQQPSSTSDLEPLLTQKASQNDIKMVVSGRPHISVYWKTWRFCTSKSPEIQLQNLKKHV